MSKINIFKYILKSIWSKKIVTILMMIQMTIGIILIVNCYADYKIINYPRVQVEEKLKINSKDTHFLKINNLDLSDLGAENYFSFEKNMREVFGYENSGSNLTMHVDFKELNNNQKILEIRKKAVDGTLRASYPEAIPHIRVDYGLYKMLDLKIVKGRELKKDDFNKKNTDIIPIIISDKYINEINISSVLSHGANNSRYEVVGFFNKDLSWLMYGGSIHLKLDDLSDEFIIPMIMLEDDFKAPMAMQKSQSFYVKKPEGMLENDFKRMISEIGNKNNLKVEAISLDEEIERYIEVNKEIVLSSIMQAIFIIALVCASMSIVMVYSLKKKRREIGILIANGMTKGQLCNLMCMETIFILLCSFTLGMREIWKSIEEISMSTSFDGISGLLMINNKDFIWILILIILLSILINIPILVKVIKLEPSEIIRGVE